MLLYNTIGTEIFGNARIMEILNCSESTATTYIKRLNYLEQACREGNKNIITVYEPGSEGLVHLTGQCF